MALSIYHVTGTARLGHESEPAVYGVCADGKTDAARIVHERAMRDGYDSFTWRKTERVAPASAWEPGNTIRY